MNGEDMLFATKTLGLEDYYKALKIYLDKYRESGLVLQTQGAPRQRVQPHKTLEPITPRVVGQEELVL